MTTTLGFSIEEKDRQRLTHLTDVFGGGNRSALLRRALDVMEKLDLAQRLERVQAYGEGKLVERGLTSADIPAIIDKAIANGSPEAIAQAKLIVADISRRWSAPRLTPPDEGFMAVYESALQEIL